MCKSTRCVQADVATPPVFARRGHQAPGIPCPLVRTQAWRCVDIDVATVIVKGGWGSMEVNLQLRCAAPAETGLFCLETALHVSQHPVERGKSV